jgi:hypothetical protein
MQLSKPPKPKATRKRLKKEILSDDFKTRKMFWKNIAENFLQNFPYGKIFHLTSLVQTSSVAHPASCPLGTGVFSQGVKLGRGVMLTTYTHLVPRS